jgi:hypothetical protein
MFTSNTNELGYLPKNKETNLDDVFWKQRNRINKNK